MKARLIILSLILSSVLLFTSCTSKYTISVSDDFIIPIENIRVFEYTENGDRIYENMVELKRGETKTFTAKPKTKKIKVYISLQNIFTKKVEYTGWLPVVYYLSLKESKVIRIDTNLELDRDEP